MVHAGFPNPFDFDPWGDLLDAVLAGVAWVTTLIFETVFNLASVQLDAEWFREVYSGTLWIAFAMAFIFVIVNALLVAMNKLSAGEFFETITRRLAMFFAISLYAPWVAQGLATGTAQVAANFLAWGVNGARESVAETVSENILSLSPDTVGGSVILALVLSTFWLLAAFGITLALLILGFFQYLAVALFPVMWAFYTSSKHRHVAKKAAGLVIALFLAVPVMCLALGITFRLFGGAAEATAGNVVLGSSLEDEARGYWFMATGVVGMLISSIVPLLVVMGIWKLGSGAVQAASSIGTGASTGAGAVGAGATAGAAKGSSAALGTAAVGTAAGSVVPGAGNAAGAVAGAGGGAATGAAGGATAGAAGGAGGGAASGAASGAGRASVAQATEQGLQQSTYAGQHATQNATQGAHLSQADEREAGTPDE